MPVSTVARKDARNQNAGERAGENHEEQIVAGVHGRQNEDKNHAEVNDAFAGEPVIDLIDDPAQTGAPRELRHDRDGHPSGEAQRDGGGDARPAHAALLRHRRGKRATISARGKHQHGDAKITPSGPVALLPRHGAWRTEDLPSESSTNAYGLHRDASGIDDFAEDGFGLLGFFLGGNVARADHHAVREHGNDQPLEIVGQAEIAAFRNARACAARCSITAPRGLTPRLSCSVCRVRSTISSA